MYHQTVIDRRLTNLADSIRAGADPDFTWKGYSSAEIQNWCAHLEKLYDPVTESLIRPLADEESRFIREEINRSKVDFPHWLTNFCKIKSKEALLTNVIPTLVQELLISRIADEELLTLSNPSGDGILLAVLKARQLGVSTISECIIGHRVFFYGNIAGLIASDVDDHTQNLYEMVVRVLDNLPWFMKPKSADPKRDYRSKNKLLSFNDQDSIIRFGSGKNMQGGQDQEKGSIGTGQTLHLFHISEFALWSNAEQVYDAVLPAVPRSPRTFGIVESTAKGRGNEWHLTWERAKRGLGRLKPVFFPYYVDPRDYRLPAPTDWIPSIHTIAHAERVRESSPRWVGRSVTLTRDQMFWYEKTHAEYKEARMLYKFLGEYTADDMESFQATTLGVFPSEMIDDMRQKTGRTPTIVEIHPRSVGADA